MPEDIQIKREIVLEADAQTVAKMRKEGHARGFTIYCDEAERTGGENTAPRLSLTSPSRSVLTADADFPVRGNDEGQNR